MKTDLLRLLLVEQKKHLIRVLFYINFSCLGLRTGKKFHISVLEISFLWNVLHIIIDCYADCSKRDVFNRLRGISC